MVGCAVGTPVAPAPPHFPSQPQGSLQSNRLSLSSGKYRVVSVYPLIDLRKDEVTARRWITARRWMLSNLTGADGEPDYLGIRLPSRSAMTRRPPFPNLATAAEVWQVVRVTGSGALACCWTREYCSKSRCKRMLMVRLSNTHGPLPENLLYF
jgi:hypothetical protein